MFTLVGHLFASIIWGVLLAIILLIILRALIKIIFSPYTYSISSLLIVSVAFVMLTWQTIQMVGGFYAKGYVATVVETATAALPEDGVALSTEQVRKLNEQVKQLQSTLGYKFDNLEGYLSQIEAGVRLNRTEIIKTISFGFQSTVNWFIWKRVFWILGIVVVSTILAGLLGKQGVTNSSRRGGGSRHARVSSGASSSTHNRRHRSNI